MLLTETCDIFIDLLLSWTFDRPRICAGVTRLNRQLFISEIYKIVAVSRLSDSTIFELQMPSVLPWSDKKRFQTFIFMICGRSQQGLRLQFLFKTATDDVHPSEDQCTELPPDKTHLTTDVVFPIAGGNTLLVKCEDEDLVLHGSLHITCIKGITFHNQTDPTCEPGESQFLSYSARRNSWPTP